MEQLTVLKKWLEEKMAACEAAGMARKADDRADEASFEKIRENVYGIFHTVADVARKQADPRCFFASKLKEIPANWAAALEQARKFGAADKAAVEEIKLTAAEEIRAEWEALV